MPQARFCQFFFYLQMFYYHKLCSVDKIAAQEISVKAQLPIMRMVFSMWMLDENCSYLLLDQIQKVNLFYFYFTGKPHIIPRGELTLSPGEVEGGR